MDARRTAVASLGLCKAPARFEEIAEVIAHVHKMLMRKGREAAGKKGESEIFWRGSKGEGEKRERKKGKQFFFVFSSSFARNSFVLCYISHFFKSPHMAIYVTV